jgi:sugar/nucleoside kinase (ribokinase family)
VGGRYGFWRAASLTSIEIQSGQAVQILANTDLLAINLDEAAALGGLDAEEATTVLIFEAAVAKLQEIQPHACLAVTAGKTGSWTWDGFQRQRVAAIDVPVNSTAGAGDAFLAGLIAGKAAGLTMGDSQYLATLAAGYSVTSPHTIHPGLNRESLSAFVHSVGIQLPGTVIDFLRKV